MIVYSTDQLLSYKDCDEVKREIADEKRVLEYKKTTFTYSKDNAATTSVDVTADISATNVELSGYRTMLPTLAGRKLDEFTRKITKLENKLDALGFRKEDMGGVRLVKRQIALNQLESELTVLEDAEAVIDAHRATLTA